MSGLQAFFLAMGQGSGIPPTPPPPGGNNARNVPTIYDIFVGEEANPYDGSGTLAPDIEGYGKDVLGGAVSGTEVVFVTNLNDSGAGSFRAAVTGSGGPRYVVPVVSGVVALQSPVFVTRNVTIDCRYVGGGQGFVVVNGMETNPGGGWFTPLVFRGADQTVLRYLKVYPGSPGTYTRSDGDAVTFFRDTSGNDSVSAVVDHCVFAFTIDEAADFRLTGTSTISYNVFGMGIARSQHDKTFGSGAINHDFGPICKYQSGRFSYHHNFFTQFRDRCVLVGLGSSGIVDFRWNHIYSCFFFGPFDPQDGGAFSGNIVGNVYREGPYSVYSANGGFYDILVGNANSSLATLNLYVQDNYGWGPTRGVHRTSSGQSQLTGVQVRASGLNSLGSPVSTPAVTGETVPSSIGAGNTPLEDALMSWMGTQKLVNPNTGDGQDVMDSLLTQIKGWHASRTGLNDRLNVPGFSTGISYLTYYPTITAFAPGNALSLFEANYSAFMSDQGHDPQLVNANQASGVVWEGRNVLNIELFLSSLQEARV